ncbi:MAG TPA: type II toxin-antitoxin system RelE/ParE family toxin [Pyrinomonadaceae bacterium]|nr:type II toxin-antitoxin system RelE/ParE family toxin [Pyrinomonadaceae bacterium]
MKLRLALKPQADRDINNQFEYIAKDNLEAAIRFYEAAFSAFEVLQTNPLIGPARAFENPELDNVRIWLVKGFDKYLIFYRATDELVEILRVLHTSRDIDRVLSNEESATE